MHFGFIRELSKQEHLVVGLDIGTTKVCALVAEALPGARDERRRSGTGLNILGAGMTYSRGIKKGVITNIESMAECIREAVREAEASAGVDIKAVHIGITGGHIGAMSSHGVIAVKEKEIGQVEVDSVIDAAKAVALPFDREMLHVIPSGFSVNGQNGISDPRGMRGVRLETRVEIITCAATSMQNLLRCCQRAGLDVIDIVFQPLAAGETVLSDDEKDIGVGVIDIGGGTTDIALFSEGTICHASVISIGGNNFTNDLAVGLRMPANEAEALKVRHGCALLSMIDDKEDVELGYIGSRISRTIPRSYLVEILQPRAEELFSLIKKEIDERELHKDLNAGIVLTGGGVLMEGIGVMAENMLDLPVRIGEVHGIEGPAEITGSPVHSAGIGLALHAAEEELAHTGARSEGTISGLKSKMKGWIGGVFQK